MKSNTILRAAFFAAEAHKDQRRKGGSKAPYVNHVLQVAALVSEFTDDEATIVAALLHDTIEDTDVTAEDIEEAFGEDALSLVLEVTDNKALPKAERKRLQIENAPKKTTRAKLIKIADKLCNFRDLVEDPPPSWSDERQQEYFNWGKSVIDGLRGEHPEIEALFDATFAEGTSKA